jgi:hypothetical protein
MTTTTQFPPSPPVLPAARKASLRVHLFGRSVVIMLTSMTGVALFVLWVTLVAISPISIVAPLLIPVAALVRAYANAHRRSAADLLGAVIEPSYRTPSRPGLARRIWNLESDPASWRDALWLLVHAVVAFVTSTLAVMLLLGSVFYAIYPFLFWVTPEAVFGHPFGGLVHFHTVGQASVMMALAPVAFGLWLALQLPLSRAELRVTQAMLGHR